MYLERKKRLSSNIAIYCIKSILDLIYLYRWESIQLTLKFGPLHLVSFVIY